MTPNTNKMFGFLFVIGSTFFTHSGAALTVIGSGEENVTLLNDQYPAALWGYKSPTVSAGDFNGDGYADVFVLIESSLNGIKPVVEMFLGPFESPSKFSTKSAMTISGLSSEGFTGSLSQGLLADLNVDGKDDLILRRSAHSLDILFGHGSPFDNIDLDQETPDIRILGKPNSSLGQRLEMGDFNGDDTDDLVIGSPGTNECYLLYGSSNIASGVLDLATGTPLPRIIGNKIGSIVTKGDFNADGKDDLILSNANAINSTGESWVLFGGSDFRDPWDLSSSPADVRIIGGVYVEPRGAADLTGDKRDEILFQEHSNTWAMDGADVDSGRPVLTRSTGTPNSVTFHPLLEGERLFLNKSLSMDFDRDGRKDFFSLTVNDDARAILTSDLLVPMSLGNGGAASLAFSTTFETIASGDFNGDGFQDLAGYQNFGFGTLPPFGAIHIYYGFRPLKNPSVSILPSPVPGPHVALSLSVQGDPTEMNISGDIRDPFKDQWIPFQSRQNAVLTSEQGAKRVAARFRNAVGRVSDTGHTDPIPLTVAQSQVTVWTSRVTAIQSAVLDCHLLEPGRIKATVYNRSGEKVADLVDEERGVGVWPVQWDGRNSQGHPVAPGFYVLVVESSGQKTKTTILVQR